MSLATMLDGYFHQDFVVEHGTAEGAARAFARDATLAELREATRELDAFLAMAEGESRHEWLRRLQRHGGAWRPRSLDSVRKVADVVREAGGGELGAGK